MFKLGLEKVEEPEIKLPTSVGSYKKQENSRKKKICFIDYAEAFDFTKSKFVDFTTNYGKFFNR